MAEALDVCVKWPNDLVTSQHRKLAGILAELELEASGRVRHIVLGVGVNVNQTVFPGLPDATSLATERGAPQDRSALLVALVRAIESAPVGGPAGLDLWRARSATLGRRVYVDGVEGVAEDIRDDGALIVGGRAVLTGDVALLG